VLLKGVPPGTPFLFGDESGYPSRPISRFAKYLSFVAADVRVESFMSGLASAGLRLRFDRPSGRFVIDDQPASTIGRR
jgi:hypothetical protein